MTMMNCFLRNSFSCFTRSFKFKSRPGVFPNFRLPHPLTRVSSKPRSFHVTSPRNALPPPLVMLLRFLAKLGAPVFGKLIRRWWSKLTPEEKAKVLEQIKSRKSKIAFAGTVFAGFSYLVYLDHVVEDPITKRRKFMFINEQQMLQIADFEYERLMNQFKTLIVPSFHPLQRRALRVANNILVSNMDFPQVKTRSWTVTVIDSPEIINAFALPNGRIFVFTGMLNLCTNDDQLAFILAHEVAHCILSHVSEKTSKIFLVEFIFLIPTVVIWTIFPLVWALFSEWLTFTLAQVFIHLPFSRSLEREADVVGLQMAARSCFDVTEAPILWSKLKKLGVETSIEWLSTHPKHESRQMELQELVPEALKIRELNNCPPLRFKFAPRLF